MNLIGEFECKLDQKGRMLFPNGFKKQLSEGALELGFVLNRGFEKCLVLYPKVEWEQIVQGVNSLNQYVKKNRDFVRYFYRGAQEILLDKVGRVLINKSMLGYAGIVKEVVLFGYFNRIEVWDKQVYYGLIDDEPRDFSRLAEEVMGKKNIDNEGDSV